MSNKKITKHVKKQENIIQNKEKKTVHGNRPRNEIIDKLNIEDIKTDIINSWFSLFMDPLYVNRPTR